MQHCEVEATREGLYPNWWPDGWRWSWKTDIRSSASGASHHPTVSERYKLTKVQQMSRLKPYRPPSLIYDRNYSAECQAANGDCLPIDFEKVWTAVQKKWTEDDAENMGIER